MITYSVYVLKMVRSWVDDDGDKSNARNIERRHYIWTKLGCTHVGLNGVTIMSCFRFFLVFE